MIINTIPQFQEIQKQAQFVSSCLQLNQNTSSMEVIASKEHSQQQVLKGTIGSARIPSPPSSSAEDLKLKDASATATMPDHVVKPQEATTSSAQSETTIATDRNVASDLQKETVSKYEGEVALENNAPRKKSFSMFGTLRKLSTTNIKTEKQDSTPQPDIKPQLITPVSPIEHFEMQRTSTMSTTSSKKSTSSLFRSISKAVRFTSKSAPNSPMNRSASIARSPITPVSPMSPLSGRANPDELRRPTRTSTKPSEKSFSPSALRRESFRPQAPEKRVYVMPTPLKSASTWSPESLGPVLSSNPAAKMYTIWPKYPIIDTQIAEVQELLEGLLANDKKAIETSREPGSQLVVHYWKAPLTAEQAEVLKANTMVSSVQLSKLDYDMSDMF